MTAPSVSYHLRILREAGLISAERRGTWVYYRVEPTVMARMSAVLVPAAGRAGGRVNPPGPARPALARRALAEFTGTGLLVAVVVGSGIMAVRLSPGAIGLELLENSLATAAGLAVSHRGARPGVGRAPEPGRVGRRLGAGPAVRGGAAGPGRSGLCSGADGGRDRRGGAGEPDVRAARRHGVGDRPVGPAPAAGRGRRDGGPGAGGLRAGPVGPGALAPAAVAGWVGAAYWGRSPVARRSPTRRSRSGAPSPARSPESRRPACRGSSRRRRPGRSWARPWSWSSTRPSGRRLAAARPRPGGKRRRPGGPGRRELKGRRLRWRTFPKCCSCAPTTRAGRRWRRRCWPARPAVRCG